LRKPGNSAQLTPQVTLASLQTEAHVGFTQRKEAAMDGTTIIRIVAGVLFVIVLVILIQRRRTRVK
jgi:hypothetical protein